MAEPTEDPTTVTDEAPAAAEVDDTDKPLGPAGEKALKAERARADKLDRDNKAAQAELAKFRDAGKSEQDKLSERATAAESRANEAEARALRLEIAHDKGLTPSQARRLVGNTKEELEADADELLETFGGTKPPATPNTPGRRPAERGIPRPHVDPDKEDDPTDLAKQILKIRRGG